MSYNTKYHYILYTAQSRYSNRTVPLIAYLSIKTLKKSHCVERSSTIVSPCIKVQLQVKLVLV